MHSLPNAKTPPRTRKIRHVALNSIPTNRCSRTPSNSYRDATAITSPPSAIRTTILTLTYLHRGKHNPVGRFAILAVMIERLQQKIRCSSGREVETDNFHVGECSKSGEKRHGFARTRWSTQNCNKRHIQCSKKGR